MSKPESNETLKSSFLRFVKNALTTFWQITLDMSNFGLRCEPRNPNPRVNRSCRKRNLLSEFSALFADPSVGISRFASHTDKMQTDNL